MEEKKRFEKRKGYAMTILPLPYLKSPRTLESSRLPPDLPLLPPWRRRLADRQCAGGRQHCGGLQGSSARVPSSRPCTALCRPASTAGARQGGRRGPSRSAQQGRPALRGASGRQGRPARVPSQGTACAAGAAPRLAAGRRMGLGLQRASQVPCSTGTRLA